MIIAVDFDGTLCENQFPLIGKPYEQLINRLVKMRENGHEIILWTCREGKKLNEAVSWCENFGLKFDAVNKNVESLKHKDFAFRKIYADIYVDDRGYNPTYFLNSIFD